MYWQAATHLKILAKRASLNEGRAKAARAYKAKVASLTSERAELLAQMQNMTQVRSEAYFNGASAGRG